MKDKDKERAMVLARLDALREDCLVLRHAVISLAHALAQTAPGSAEHFSSTMRLLSDRLRNIGTEAAENAAVEADDFAELLEELMRSAASRSGPHQEQGQRVGNVA